MTPVSDYARYLEIPSSNNGLKILDKIVRKAAEADATEVYLRKGYPISFLAKGSVQHAINWDMGEKGIISDGDFMLVMLFVTNPETKEMVWPSKQPLPANSFTRVFRFEKNQLRLQYSPYQHPPQLTLRVQPLAPYPIEAYLPYSPSLIDSLDLAKSSGLYLVAGPVGSGKTSLASSITQMWAKSGNHIAMLADPIEYYIAPETHLVSTWECSLTTAGQREGTPFVDAIIPDLLRSKVAAYYVSEVREAASVSAVLELSRSREPVITTFHAASIADAVVSFMSLADRILGHDRARIMTGQMLEGVFYVNVVYGTSKYVPVIEFLPFQKCPPILKALESGTTRQIADAVNAEIEKNTAQGGTAIGRKLAIDNAKRLGLAELAASAALPPATQV